MTGTDGSAQRRYASAGSGAAVRDLLACVLLAAGLICKGPAFAIMAGMLPDTPEVHVDPNTPTSPWAGVGSVIVKGSPYSGVVIGPRHVLTAAHVAGDPQHTKFQLNLGGETPQVMAVAKVIRHPGFKGFDPQHPRDDLAVLVLAEEVPAGVPIYPLHHGDIDPGTVLTFVGYGASGHGDTGVTVGARADVKRVGRNTADAFSIDAFGIKRVFVFDFDGPGVPNQLGGDGLGNAVESTFAGGDSGSPSFLCEGGSGYECAGGRWVVAGINTFVTAPPEHGGKPGTFGTLGGGMVVSAYVDWIENVMRSEQS